MANSTYTQKKTGITMQRYTLWLPSELSSKIAAIADKNKRSAAWVIREYVSNCTDNKEFNEKIGLNNQ